MTDDRAKRLRELRNRTRGNRTESDGDDSDESGDDGGGPDTAEAGTSDTAETGASDTAETDGSDSADDSIADGTDESGTDGREAIDSGTTEPDTSDRTGPDGSNSAENAARAAGSGGSDGGGTGEETRAGGPPRSTGDAASTPGNAASTEGVETVSYDESAATAEPSGESAGDVEAQGIDPALRGAIADTSTMASGIDTLGQEPTVDSSAMLEDTEEYGSATIGRESAVFEQENTLIHSAHDDESTVQMLEFFLNDSRYAIEIERISAIVEMKDVTRFPRGPEAIDGVTDLRGEITGVLDPTVMLDIERNELSDDQYIVVLKRDDDKQKLGVRVTDVSQAVTYRESQIDETGTVMDTAEERQHEFIEGIIKKTTDERTTLVTWLDIDAIIEHTN